MDSQDDCYDDCERRRHLQVLEASEVAPDQCENEKYVLSVAVQGSHVVLTGEPKCEVVASGLLRKTNCGKCPTLVFHTATNQNDEEEEHLQKNVHEIHHKADAETFELGTFELGQINDAYNGASVDTSIKYSLIQNNCASLIIDMLRTLKVNPMNRKLIKFVSRKLSANADKFNIIEKLSEHEEGLAMVKAHDEDSAVIEDFVSTYIQKRV